MAANYRSVGVALGIAVGLSATSHAHAWKPITHAYLAQQAVSDLLDDEYITFDEVDPQIDARDLTKSPTIGSIKNIDGSNRFRSSSSARALVRNCPAQYYLGVVGPDAMPDIITGQSIIHPPGGSAPKDGTDINVGGPGTGYFWNHMWKQTGSGGPFDKGCNRAYVLGMFGHGAGDLFAHTFVNAHTGNIFQLNINGLRHLLLEGYIYERTPPLEKHEGKSVYDLANKGMTNDIAKFNRFVLDPYALGVNAGDARATSLLYQFGKLKQWVKIHRKKLNDRQRRWYSEYQAAYAQYAKLWNECDKKHVSTWDECAEAIALKVTKVAYRYTKHKVAGGIVRKVILPYLDDWIEDIDEGLIEWVKLNHRISMRLMFTDPTKEQPDSTISYVVDQLKDYFLAHVIRMVGIPDWVSDAALYVRDMVDALMAVIDQVIAPFKEVKQAIKNDLKAFAKWVVKKAYGISIDELKAYWFSPGKYIDSAFGKWETPSSHLKGNKQLDQDGNPVTVASLNKWMGLKDTNHVGPERFDWKRFGPAFNTVQMIKLTFLEPESVSTLLKSLGSDQKGPAKHDDYNVMLGQWQGAMDSGNQWANGKRLIFARECRVFNRLFIKHAGPNVKKPYQPINECADSDVWVKGGIPKAADPFRIFGSQSIEMEAGNARRIELRGDFDSFVVSLTGAESRRGRVSNKDQGGFTYTAPNEITGFSDDVTITATDDDGEKAVAKVRVIPNLAITPSIEAVKAGESVTFDIDETERKINWRVVKGRGKFGNDKKLADLRTRLAVLEGAAESATHDVRAPVPTSNFGHLPSMRRQFAALTVRMKFLGEIAQVKSDIDDEAATYYAPTDVKVDEERVFVAAELSANGKLEGPRQLNESFELVPSTEKADRELKKSLASNAELQVALSHAAAIDKAKQAGRLLAWDPAVVSHLKYEFKEDAFDKRAGFKYFPRGPLNPKAPARKH